MPIFRQIITDGKWPGSQMRILAGKLSGCIIGAKIIHIS